MSSRPFGRREHTSSSSGLSWASGSDEKWEQEPSRSSGSPRASIEDSSSRIDAIKRQAAALRKDSLSAHFNQATNLNSFATTDMGHSSHNSSSRISSNSSSYNGLNNSHSNSNNNGQMSVFGARDRHHSNSNNSNSSSSSNSVSKSSNRGNIHTSSNNNSNSNIRNNSNSDHEYSDAYVTSVRDCHGNEMASRIVLRLPNQTTSNSSFVNNEPFATTNSNSSNTSNLAKLLATNTTTSTTSSLSSSSASTTSHRHSTKVRLQRPSGPSSSRMQSVDDSYLKGPIDPAGKIVTLSDRPLLCASSNRRTEVVFGSADHNCYALNLAGTFSGGSELADYSTRVTKMTKMSPKDKSVHREGIGNGLSHADWVTSVCHLVDGRTVSASMDGKLCLWDRTNSTNNAQLVSSHSSSVAEVVSDNKLPIALSIGVDGLAFLWNLDQDQSGSSKQYRGGQIHPTVTLNSGSDCPLTKCQYLGPTVVVGDKGGMIFVWDVRNARIRTRLTAHPSTVSAITMTGHDSDGYVFLTGGLDGYVKHWDLRSSEGSGLVSKGRHHYSPTDDYVSGGGAVGGGGGHNNSINNSFGSRSSSASSGTSKAVKPKSVSGPSSSASNPLLGSGVTFISALSEDLIVSTGADGSLVISDLRKGLATPMFKSVQHLAGISALSTVGDTSIFSGDRGGQMLCFDARSGQCLYGMGVVSRGMAVRSLLPIDGKLVVAGDDGNALVLDFL